MKEYKSRDFCKDAGCSIQYLIDNKEEKNLKEDPKNFCKAECAAYRFHKWLKENDYKIVKDIDYTAINDRCRLYEKRRELLVVEKQKEADEYNLFIGNLFCVSNGKIKSEGLYEVKEFKEYDGVEFTPIKN